MAIIEKYSDSFEKQEFASYEQIDTINRFDSWYKDLSGAKKSIFRGVKDASFKNYTSAQRYYITNELEKRYNGDINEFIDAQIGNICKFGEEADPRRKGLLQRYCDSNGIIPNDWFYLAMSQHYGGISPLLDFSTDLNTALFFMTDGAEFEPTGSVAGSLSNYASLYFYKKEDIIYNSNEPSLQDESKYVFSLEYYYDIVRETIRQELLETQSAPQYIDRKGNVRYTDGLKSNRAYELACTMSKFGGIDGLLKECRAHSPRQISVLIENKPLYWTAPKGRQLFFTMSNIRMAAQFGCLLFLNDDTKPLEDGLHCVDIHKSLIPYIREKYLRYRRKEDIYPKEEKFVRDSISNVVLF